MAFDFGEINGKWELCSCSKKDFEFHFESLSDVVEQIMINNVGSQYFSLLIQPDVIAILLQQREHIIDTILTCLIMQTNLELGIILMNKNIDTEGIQRLDISEKGKLQEIERLSSLFDKNDDQRETSSFESLSRFFKSLEQLLNSVQSKNKETILKWKLDCERQLSSMDFLDGTLHEDIEINIKNCKKVLSHIEIIEELQCSLSIRLISIK